MQDFLTSIHYNGWVLPALLIIPLVGALVLLVQAAFAHDDGTLQAAPTARWVALITLLIELAVSLGLWWSFDPASSAWQARVSTAWIPQWGARFDVGVDGISLFMVLLTTFLMPLSVLGSWTSIKTKVRSYYALMLLVLSFNSPAVTPGIAPNTITVGRFGLSGWAVFSLMFSIIPISQDDFPSAVHRRQSLSRTDRSTFAWLFSSGPAISVNAM